MQWKPKGLLWMYLQILILFKLYYLNKSGVLARSGKDKKIVKCPHTHQDIAKNLRTRNKCNSAKVHHITLQPKGFVNTDHF